MSCNALTSRRTGSAAAVAAVLALAATAASGAPAPTDHSYGPFTYGADMRLRQVWIDNVGMNDESKTADRDFQRFRLRAWGSWAATDWLSANARLMWEGRHYVQPEKEDWRAPGFEEWYSGGILFDILNIETKRLGSLPLALKIGRQEIILGNGWLVLDGTPIDGSRTIYFDAARATYALESIGTTIDLMYVSENADTGRFPGPLNGEVEDQTEQYESGAILYVRNKSLVKDTDLDGYFIYKHDRPNENLTDVPQGLRINNGAPFPSPSDAGDIYALGARADSKPTPNWALRGEAVYEWGKRNPMNTAGQGYLADLSAWGFNGRVTYNLLDKLANAFHLGYEFLSGDDPDTRATEAFDPLWGRWPQWSELLIYQWPLETRVGEATNLNRVNLGWEAKVHPTTTVTLDYHALWADQETARTPGQTAAVLSGTDDFRGHLFTGWIKAKFNKHVSGHIVAEYFEPGKYFKPAFRDNPLFLSGKAHLGLAPLLWALLGPPTQCL